MVDLAYDWSLMGWGMRAVVIISPHSDPVNCTLISPVVVNRPVWLT